MGRAGDMQRAACALGLATTLALLVGNSAHGASVLFSDNFDRPDGSVGNGWTDAPDTFGRTLTLRNGHVEAPGPGGLPAIFRPVDYSRGVSASATFGQVNGYGGLPSAFNSSFHFQSSGSVDEGYAIHFGRSDINYANSTISLLKDGVVIDSVASDLQFTTSISSTVSFSADGHIFGSVSEAGSSFDFDFGTHDVLSGGQFGLSQGGPDGRSGTFLLGAVDDLTLTTSEDLASFVATYTLGTGLGDHLSQYQLGYDGSKFVVQMDILVGGDLMPSSVLSLWENGIEGTWGNDQYYIETPYGNKDLSFDVVFVRDDAPYDTAILGRNADCRSNSQKWCTDASSLEEHSDYYKVMAAHEFGHLLGLPDEYYQIYFPNRFAYDLFPRFPSERCVIGLSPLGEYYGKHGDRCGNLMSDLFNGPLPRHYETILSQIAANVGFTPAFGYAPDLASYEYPDLPADFPGIREAAVPEPQTWLLFIAGFALTGLTLRRSRRAFART